MELLRNPGESLREKIETIDAAIMEKVMYLCIIPTTIYSGLLGQAFFGKKPPSLGMVLILAISVLVFCLWQGNQLYALLFKRNKFRLGYECEVAAGQGLLPLARSGFHIYHDFPAAKNFNIDHIAIGPQGVFAIETKGRAKPRKAGNDNWKVKFDGEKLISRKDMKPSL